MEEQSFSAGLEDWQVDFEWLKIQHFVKDALGVDKLPDFQSILLLIGIQELGKIIVEPTKEEKQDLMHIAVCRLLSYDGFYELEGYDDDGWPHWRATQAVETKGVKAQEELLKLKIIDYFQNLENSNE